MKTRVILTTILLGYYLIFAQSEVNIDKSKKYDIFLLIGQSNMAGRGEIELQDRDTLNGVFIFTGIECQTWEPAANPLNKYSTIRKSIEMQALGPGYSFARHLREWNPQMSIGLVVNARGGTSIDEWLPGTEYYEAAISQLKTAAKDGVVRGILWHQGESDVLNMEEYAEKVTLLIHALRAEMGDPDLPFVLGELSVDMPERQVFNDLINKISYEVNNVRVVSSGGTTTFDGTHFDSHSQRLMGKRFALEIKTLLNIPHTTR